MINKKPPTPLWQWISLAAIMVPIIGFAAFMAIRQETQQADQRKTFGAAIDSYLALAPGKPNDAKARVGKVVLVDVNKRALDETQFALPDDLQATSPEEVTTVVLSTIRRDQKGTFEGGGKAVQEHYSLAVIDKATGALIGSAEMTGPEPPKTVSRSGFGQDVSGGAPLDEIIGFLRAHR